MIVSVALLAIVTALITSTFVEAAQRRRHAEEQDPARALDARLDDISARLTTIERSLDALAARRGSLQGEAAPPHDRHATET
jgi:type II secretory pathway component PulJ